MNLFNFPNLADIWNALGLYIEGSGGTSEFYANSTAAYIYTLDNELGRAAETATEAQKDFNADKDKAFGDDLKNTPWWVWAGLAISVLTLVRK